MPNTTATNSVRATVSDDAALLRKIAWPIFKTGVRQSLLHGFVDECVCRNPAPPTKIDANRLLPCTLGYFFVHLGPYLRNPPETLKGFVLVSSIWVRCNIRRLGPKNFRLTFRIHLQ